MKVINLENINAVKHRAGLYKIYNKSLKAIYVGVSKDVQHRLHALRYGRADYDQIPAKANMRKRAKYFNVRYMPIGKARKLEKEIKKRLNL